jgi:hypothetical protein
MPITGKASKHPEATKPPERPETFRIPKPGRGDPFFGLSRSFYYRGEELGYWRLIRIVEPGRKRGIVLIPFSAIAEFVRSQMERGNNI